MNNDRLLKKPELLPILKIGRNKLYDIINSGEFIKPVIGLTHFLQVIVNSGSTSLRLAGRAQGDIAEQEIG